MILKFYISAKDYFTLSYFIQYKFNIEMLNVIVYV